MFRTFGMLIALLLVFGGFTAVTAQHKSDETGIFKSIGPEEAMRMLQGRDDIVFLDVRTPRERSRGYIPGSRLVSFNDLVRDKVDLPKDRPILLVCAVGGRSYVAGQILSRKGYKEVYNLSGGVSKWYKSGLPLVHD
ncbi:MAG: hypothetical protein Kow0089_19060 [Desulfobulbaceae bacterium]